MAEPSSKVLPEVPTPLSHETAGAAFDYRGLVAAMEANLLQYGDSHRGVGWRMNARDAALQHQVMLEGILDEWARPVRLLDFGCGASHLYQHIRDQGLLGLEYSGLDLSSQYLALCRKKFPGVAYYDQDLLDSATELPTFDYVVLNGIFHYKADNSNEATWRYCQQLLTGVSAIAAKGFAFNVRSEYVDWRWEYLFHLPIGQVADFIATNISRNFTVRHDYGLYEYTVYVYHTGVRENRPAAETLPATIG